MKSVRKAVWAGLQDSVPRAALLSLHARVEGVARLPSSMVQIWGPRFNVYVVAEKDLGIFSLGRMPENAKRGARAQTTAGRLPDVLPLHDDRSWAVSVKGQIYKKGFQPEASVRVVSDAYFAAAGIPLRAGRVFEERDRATIEPVVVINETMARTLWPGQDPLGQMITQDGGRRVVGVVADVRHAPLEAASGLEMYLPMRKPQTMRRCDWWCELSSRRTVLRTLGLAVVGLAVGMVASRALASGLGSLLFGVTSSDPATFAGMGMILTAVAALAGYIPAWRASRIDPMAALRTN